MAGPGRLTIQQILDLQRRQLFGLVENRGVGRMRKIYSESVAELRDRLSGLVKSGRGGTFQAHQMRQVLLQAEQTAKGLQVKLLKHVEDNGRAATALAPRHLIDNIEKLHDHFGGSGLLVPVEQAAVFADIRKNVYPSLLDRFETSAATYGQPTIGAIRHQLAKSLVQGQSVDEAVDRVAGTDGALMAQRWRAERIVRTETSYAYGVTKQDGMVELRDTSVPKLRKRLVATFDDRTGDDSKQLNGQTVDVDQPFVWIVKNSKGIPTGKIVHYMQPPNRPNDREVTIPWMDGWAPPAQQGPITPRTPSGL